ncbi:SMI1/KNR4 family protein [Reinekea sp. G2M2-21]|uniref:SMI1/KNR4 family protein n=1 Tax=Reinekea sp. G2M2-21 TaxID=2788942 RepID=UPI0018A96A09|nr:SMI1/KNR4 family protein [Reinekea sp. G2M2-21]
MSDIEINTYEESRDIADTFGSIVSYYSEHYPEISASLNGPATETEISDLEALIGKELPSDFKALYRLANGQQDKNQPFFQNGYDFMPISAIRVNYEMMLDLYNSNSQFREVYGNSGAITDVWWKPDWIPFGYMISGDHYCIDMSPGPTGTEGQVIEFIHDDSIRYHKGLSINDFLGDLDIGLRSGKYFKHPEYEIITDEQ